jgi:LysM repeat protein
MSRRQAILLIVTNAIISLAVSIIVVTVALDRWETNRPIYPTLVLPTRAATATPLSSETMYIVQQGDSLSSIAFRFGVAIDDLMRANEITDPDRITVGQRLIIPSGPVPTAATTPTDTVLPFEPPTPVSIATDTPAPTGTPTATPVSTTPAPTATRTSTVTIEPTSTAGLIEIQTVTGAGDLATEALRLRNTSDDPISLDGWIISDGTVNEYLFGAITLEPGGEMALHTGAGEDSATDVFWNLDTALWSSGVTATLLDRDGEVVHRLSVE